MQKYIDFSISSKALVLCLFGAYVLLLSAHVGATYIYVGLEAEAGFTPWSWVYFDLEANIPTLYTIMLLGLASLLCWLVSPLGRTGTEGKWGWRILGLAFLFVAADEYLTIHETLDKILKNAVETTGALYYVWIVPYAAIAAFFGIILLPWFWKLSGPVKTLFMVSGLLYLGGAIGMEVVGGLIITDPANIAIEQNWKIPEFVIAITIEESLEMIGLSLFIWTIFRYISAPTGRLGITINAGEA